MKIIDSTPTTAQNASVQKTFSGMQKMLGNAFNLKTDETAQEVLIQRMSRALNDRYVVLRNFCIGDLDIPAPVILLGPTGIFVIYCSALKGVFRVKDETLFEIKKDRQPQPIQPNLITRTMLMTQTLGTVLAERGYKIPDIQSILFFSDPGVHVDASRPSVRILLIDSINQFTSSLLQSPPKLALEDIHNLTNFLTTPKKPPEEKKSAASGELDGLRNLLTEKIQPADPAVTRQLDKVSRKLPLTTQQWVLLGVMAGFEVLILVGFILYILLTT